MRVFAPMIHVAWRHARAALLLVSSAGLVGCLDLNPNVDACTVTVAPTNVSVAVNARSTIVGTAFDCKGNSIQNKKISFSTANASIATVAVDGSSNGFVIGISVGTTTISAVASGKTGTVQVTVTPEVASSVTVNPTAVTLRTGNQRQFTATLKNAAGTLITGRPVRWTSSNSAIASIDQNGNVIAIRPGQVVVTAEADQIVGSSSVLVTEIPIGSCTLSPATQKVTVTAQAQPTLIIRDTANAILPLQGRAITWTSDNEIVASVSQTGLVSTRQKGIARITATSSENTTVSCSASVEAVDARIVSVTIQQRTGSLRIGIPRQLSAQVLDSANNLITGRIVTWTSVTPIVASVTNLGIVTGNALGNARIAVSAEGVSDTVGFPVTKIPVGKVTVSPLQTTVFEGQTAQFTAVVEDSAGTVITDRPIEWISSDPTRATVSSTGLARTIAAGAVGITAATEGRNATSTLVILQIPVDTIIAPPTFSIVRGTTTGFTITLRDANGNEIRNRVVSVVSAQPNIAAVPQLIQTSTVPVSAIAVGQTELTLRALNSNGQAEGKATKVTVIVTLPPAGVVTGGNITSSAARGGPP